MLSTLRVLVAKLLALVGSRSAAADLDDEMEMVVCAFVPARRASSVDPLVALRNE